MNMGEYTKGKLKVNGNQTGGTTPSGNIFAGKDWDYDCILFGEETIAVCPNQDGNTIPGKHSIQINGSGKANANRLTSCWNACLNLENPESDIPKLVEALKNARTVLTLPSLKAWDSRR
jgi:hypothetical protein